MSDKINIAYIGKKAFKKDTITGSRLVFPRLKPVPVSVDIAYQLLDYPTVFVNADEMEEVKKKQEEAEKAEALRKEALAKIAKEEALNASMLVIIDGETVDIQKYTSATLATLVEAQDLEVTVPKSPVDAYRTEIRYLLREQNGTPEVEQY